MRLRMGVAVLVASLSLPCTAGAVTVTTMSPLVDALHKAHGLWGETACGGVIDTNFEWPNPGVAIGLSSRVGGCKMWIDPSLSWPLYCSAVLHEYGHLLGWEHYEGRTREQRRVMSPQLFDDIDRCGWSQ